MVPVSRLDTLLLEFSNLIYSNSNRNCLLFYNKEDTEATIFDKEDPNITNSITKLNVKIRFIQLPKNTDTN